VLAMYMDRDQPIIFGRELFGEPKKQAVSRLQRRGPHMSGWVMRDGVRLIEIEAELTEESVPENGEGLNFNYKATPSCDGIGLEDDAILTVATFATELTLIRTGTGTLTLRSTVNDPLGEIEIVSVLGASYIEGDLITSCRAAARIPADELPSVRIRANGRLERARHRSGPERGGVTLTNRAFGLCARPVGEHGAGGHSSSSKSRFASSPTGRSSSARFTCRSIRRTACG